MRDRPPRERGRNVDTQATLQPETRARDQIIGGGEVGEYALAPGEIFLALGCKADLAGRAIEELAAEPRLELSYQLRNSGARKAQVVRRAREAAELRDPRKGAHREQLIETGRAAFERHDFVLSA